MSPSRRQTEAIERLVYYNPLDEENLAKQVAVAVESGSVRPLPPPRFIGSGVYALYYLGNHQLYEELSELSRQGGTNATLGVGPTARPIYVGKAQLGSGRHGGLESVGATSVLYNRIRKHWRSISAASTSVSPLGLGTLNPDDFRCRYLGIRDIWVPLAEHGIISAHRPVWNLAVDGFGNNDPGAGRKDMARPLWDILHPGRDWAEKLALPMALDLEAVTAAIKEFVFQAVHGLRPDPGGALLEAQPQLVGDIDGDVDET